MPGSTRAAGKQHVRAGNLLPSAKACTLPFLAGQTADRVVVDADAVVAYHGALPDTPGPVPDRTPQHLLRQGCVLSQTEYIRKDPPTHNGR